MAQQEAVQVQVQCSSCRGGLYREIEWGSGIAVICRVCNGTGVRTITFIPYNGREVRDDITTVYRSVEKYSGLKGEQLTYPQFLEEVPAAEITS